MNKTELVNLAHMIAKWEKEGNHEKIEEAMMAAEFSWEELWELDKIIYEILEKK